MEKLADTGGDLNHRRAEEVSREQAAFLPKKEQEEEIQFQRPNIVNCPTELSTYYKGKDFGKLISMLRRVGGKESFDKFRSSCFGHLIGLDFGYKCTKTLHHLAARLLKINDGDEDLWFYIRGSKICFSVSEYALITGLNFGGSSFDPTTQHDLRGATAFQAFCGGQQMGVSDLVRRVLDRSRMVDDNDGSLYLRAVLVCVAHTIIFGSDRCVEGWVWSLVENLEAFNKFPWGAYSYRLFLYYMRNGGGQRGKKWHLYGPQWALSIWGFERIKGLGEEVARYVGGGSLYPRCLRWKFRIRSVTEDVDWQVFFEDKEREILDMHPDKDEMEQAYYATSTGPTPLGVCFTASDNKLTRGPKPGRRSTAARRPVEEGSTSTVVAATTHRRGTQHMVVEKDEGLQDVDIGREDVDVGLHDVDVGLGEQPCGSTSTADVGKRMRPSTSSSLRDSHGATPSLRLTSRDRQWVQETIRQSERRVVRIMKRLFTEQLKKWRCENSHSFRSYNPSQQRMPNPQRVDTNGDDATSHDKEGMHHDRPVQSVPSSPPPPVHLTSLRNPPRHLMHEVGSRYGGPHAEIQERSRHSMSETRCMKHPVDLNLLEPREDFVSQGRTEFYRPQTVNSDISTYHKTQCFDAVSAVLIADEELQTTHAGSPTRHSDVHQQTHSGPPTRPSDQTPQEYWFSPYSHEFGISSRAAASYHQESTRHSMLLFDKLETPPGFNVEIAKAVETSGEKKKKQSFHGGSPSMHISRKTENEPSPEVLKKPAPEDACGRDDQCEVLRNDPRFDSGVAGRWKPFANQEDSVFPNEESRLKLDCPLRAQSNSTEPSKQKAGMGPPRAANVPEWLADLLSSKMTAKMEKKLSSVIKRMRRYPSSDDETSDDEGSKPSSSSDDERRRKMKKRGKRRKRKQSESSSSESPDSDRHRRRKNKHKRRRASSSESSDSDARGCRRHHRHRHPHRQRHRYHYASSSD